MYEIERTEYGLHISIDGQIARSEVQPFAERIRSAVRDLSGGFGVVADLRGMDALPPEVGDEIVDLMTFCTDSGIERSADVVDSATTTLQMGRLIDRAGIDERVVDASEVSDPDSVALDWVNDGVEPSD